MSESQQTAPRGPYQTEEFMQVKMLTSLQFYKFTSLQVYKSASILAYKSASLYAFKNNIDSTRV
jgi:hypothetical protein